MSALLWLLACQPGEGLSPQSHSLGGPPALVEHLPPPSYHDNWSQARALCDWMIETSTTGRFVKLHDGPYYELEGTFQVACQHPLIDHMDLDYFSADDSAGLDAETAEAGSRILTLTANAMVELVATDLGLVEDARQLDPDGLSLALGAQLLGLQAQQAEPELGPLLYNLITSGVTRSAFDPDLWDEGGGTSCDATGGEIWTGGHPNHIEVLTAMAHVSAHIWWGLPHVPCEEDPLPDDPEIDEGDLRCDPDRQGANAWGLLMARALDRHISDTTRSHPEVREGLERSIARSQALMPPP